ncbi:hypothetical protein A28LD_0013 [Idiomarina sp. A28L]|uniref:WD40/YVTN/BNR-like repeat-containing protein n=1 Tax=Idiomarina sp. A28L TaxID=1036674 RepID=UPI0002138E8C|nr:hypothetical protein [Idiomarina sp. A28L]EGN76281.1 hypothetical protein A28LD_0013 [Idiomarina sp. A28L]
MAILKRKYFLLPLALIAYNTSVFATEGSELPTAPWSSIYVVDADTIWVGSSDGKVAVTADAGANWSTSTPGGRSTNLNIRQIIAHDERHAFVLSSGRGERSRLLQSRNAGFSWSTLYRANGDEYLHCFDMIPNGEGWILGESIQENWHVIRSSNNSNWMSTRSGFTERSMIGESASEIGNCVKYSENYWVMGTKDATQARLIYKSAPSLRFQVENTPLTAGAGSGIHAVAVVGARDFVMSGGPEDGPAELYRYEQGSFTELAAPPVTGPLTLLIKTDKWLITGNTSGIYKSANFGQSWALAAESGALAIACTESSNC